MKPKRLLCAFPALAATFLASSGLSSADTYTQDFTAADGTTDLGDGSVIGSTTNTAGSPTAQVTGNQLRLTSTLTTSTRSSFRIPAVADSKQGWKMTFDVTLTDAVGGNVPADGFSVSYGAIPGPGVGPASGHGNAEAGFGSGNEISFRVDTWQNGTSSTGFDMFRNGTSLAARVEGTVVPTDGSVSGTVTICWDPYKATYTTTGLTTNASFTDIVHGYAGSDDYSWVISARTGGATEDLIIDNLVLTTGVLVDNDGDGLSEGWEQLHNLDDNDDGTTNPDFGASGDPDGDGLSNLDEQTFCTDPNQADADGDGLSDPDELFTYGTDPANADTDGDGRNDFDEVLGSPTTDPNDPDSDDDGFLDGYEVSNSPPFDPNADDASADFDSDGLDNGTELALGTDPLNADSDGDGASDGDEDTAGTDPNDPLDIPGFTNISLEAGALAAIGVHNGFDLALPGVNYDHAGSGALLIDGVSGGTSRVDTWNGDKVHSAFTQSYVQILWDCPRPDLIRSVSVELATFVDGGWWGVNGATPGAGGVLLDPNHVSAATVPQVQLSYDYGRTWTTVPTTDDYLAVMVGSSIGGGANPNPTVGPTVTFLLDDPAIGANGIRVIGTDGGNASGGFLGAHEVTVLAAPDPDDADGDGLPASWEALHGFDDGVANGGADPDGDGITNLDEYNGGTDPNSADSDGDGTSDPGEIAAGTNAKTPNVYKQDFDAFADGTTDLGDGSSILGTASVAQVIGGELRLNDNVNSQFGQIYIPPLADVSLGYTMTFDYTINTAGSPADGFTVVSGPLPAGEGLYRGFEEGFTGFANILSFEMDTHAVNGGDRGPTIGYNRIPGGLSNSAANWNFPIASPNFPACGDPAGPTVAYQAGNIVEPGTTVTGTVTITVYPNGVVSFTSTGAVTNAGFVNVPTNYSPSNSDILAIVARTGGLNSLVLIDNLCVVTGIVDTDGDGMPDDYEVAHGLDINSNDAGSDADGDGISNLDEMLAGTSPSNPDTDGDGLDDGGETTAGTNPKLADSDGDGLSDGDEVNICYLSGPMDPLQAGTNGGFGSFDAGTPGAGLGSGNINGAYDTTSMLLDYTLTWQDLTSAETNAHFHVGAPGVSGGVDLAIPGPWVSPYSASGVLLSASQEANLLAGNWYVNIHTSNFTGGEIRGQVILLKSDPLNANTDGDGLNDGDETNAGRNPTVFDDPTSYKQDFTGVPDGTTGTALNDGSDIASNNAVAFVQNEQLQITSDDVGGSAASVRLPAFSGSSTGWTWQFTCIFSDAPGEGAPADGWSVNYGAIPARTTNGLEVTGHGGAEAGWGAVEHVAFVIDTWDNGGGENGVNISGNVGGVQTNNYAENNAGTPLGDGETRTANVTIWYDAETDSFTFFSKGLNLNPEFFDVAVPGFVPNDAYSFGFSARTGGADELLIVDDLCIESGDPDGDNDGLHRNFELTYGLDDADDGSGDVNNGPSGDPDGDGLDNRTEQIQCTDPTNDDTDGDGLTDADEVNVHGTNPLEADTDGDGLSDPEEINTTNTDPTNADSDSDGLSDGEEVNTTGTDPNDADSDDDGVIDGSDGAPLDPNNDDDGDGLSNIDETNTHFTDPLNPDTDGDGLDDNVEINTEGTDPNNPNTDGDCETDLNEVRLRDEIGQARDPLVADDPVPTNTYSQNFDAFPDGFPTLGDCSLMVGTARIANGALELTTNTNSNNAAFHIPALVGTSTGWCATFDFTIIDNTPNPPADGWSFSSGPLPWGALSGQAEEGFPGVANAVSFEVDTWNDPAGEGGPTIGFNRPAAPTNSLNASTLAHNAGLFMADQTTVTGTATIVVAADGTLDFMTASTGALLEANFAGIVSAFVPNDLDTFAFAARTGGANEEVVIDNLVITTGPKVGGPILYDVELNAALTEGTIHFRGLTVGNQYHLIASDDGVNFIPLTGSTFTATSADMAVGPIPTDVVANPLVIVKADAGAAPVPAGP